MTDWLLIDYLAERQAEDNIRRQQQQAQQAAIDKQIKDQVSAQVKEAMAAYQAKDEKKLSYLSRAMDKKHIFVVHDEISVTDVATGDECDLTQGDLIRVEQTPDKLGADGKPATFDSGSPASKSPACGGGH